MRAASAFVRLTVAMALALALAPKDARAFPIFARKYEVSCAQCHVAVPKLNAFGIAFRNQGYQWPRDEREMAKDKPIELAVPGDREKFPRAIWPSWFPHTVPVAFAMTNEVSWDSASRGPSPEGLGANLELLVGAAIAEDLAARANVALDYDSASNAFTLDLEQAFMQVHNIDLHDFLDMRFGKLHPELFSFTPQQLGGDLWLYQRPRDDGWKLAGRQGIELRTTFLNGRARAVTGVAGANGLFGEAYDGWARLGLKWGGQRYDGLGLGEEQSAGPLDPSHPWRDGVWSLQVGGLGYLFGRDGELVLGADASLWVLDANLIAAYMAGPRFRRALVQLDYVIFPWLIPTLRYELSNDSNGPPWHALAGVSGLTRANIRIYLFGEVAPDSATGAVAFSKATLGVLTAF